MVGALLMGYGLVGLAAANLAAEALGRSARLVVAYRVCPWLEIRWKHFRWATAREMLSFGGKSFMTQISQLLMNSSVSLLIAGHLGPAALALYARPLALVRNLGVFVHKYAMVFSPTISSFQGAGRHDEVRDLALGATRYGLYLSLPILLLFAIHGDAVLQVWMGANYAQTVLIAVIVLGFFNQIAYIPLYGALVGLNLHGRLGVANLVGRVARSPSATWRSGCCARGRAAPRWPWRADGVVNGVFLPLYACRVTETPLDVLGARGVAAAGLVRPPPSPGVWRRGASCCRGRRSGAWSGAAASAWCLGGAVLAPGSCPTGGRQKYAGGFGCALLGGREDAARSLGSTAR